MKNITRTKIAITAFVAALGLAVLAGGSSYAGGAGQTALSKCVDSVVAACNKKSTDKAIAACTDSGVSQCEKQHKAQIQLPPQGPRAATNVKTNGQTQPSRN